MLQVEHVFDKSNYYRRLDKTLPEFGVFKIYDSRLLFCSIPRDEFYSGYSLIQHYLAYRHRAFTNEEFAEMVVDLVDNGFLEHIVLNDYTIRRIKAIMPLI